MRNVTPDTLAVHNSEVAIITHALAVIGNKYYGRHYDCGRAVLLALYHDAPEIMTGDLPSPVKYWSPSIRDAYREVEAHSTERLLSLLPEALRPAFERQLRPPDAGVRELVHAADKLSAYLKSAQEIRAGNTEFGSAAGQLFQKLKELDMKEVDYFLTNFYPSFTLTLDELK